MRLHQPGFESSIFQPKKGIQGVLFKEDFLEVREVY
jgi:hypothetical protein